MASNIDDTIDLSYKILGGLWVLGLVCLVISFYASGEDGGCNLAAFHIDKC